MHRRLQWTPLHFAARFNAAETAALLLEARADVEAADKVCIACGVAAASLPDKSPQYGRRPLHAAAMGNAAGVVALLLGAGANVGSADKCERQALHWAAHCDASSVAAALALAPGVELDVKDADGTTPLAVACDEVPDAVVAAAAAHVPR